MKKNRIEIYLSFIVVVLSAVFMRLIPHTPNVAPIAALALFSGVMVPNWIGFAIPLIAMVLSDIFLGFHATIPFVYGSFLLIAGIGYLLRKKSSPLNIGLGSLSGSVLFFVITNFGVWLTSSLYEKSIGGLVQSYLMGLPFFRNTLVGDIFYTTVFFVGFNCIRLLFVLMSPSHQKWERRVGNTV
jgi:hypothetical protein